MFTDSKGWQVTIFFQQVSTLELTHISWFRIMFFFNYLYLNVLMWHWFSFPVIFCALTKHTCRTCVFWRCWVVCSLKQYDNDNHIISIVSKTHTAYNMYRLFGFLSIWSSTRLNQRGLQELSAALRHMWLLVLTVKIIWSWPQLFSWWNTMQCLQTFNMHFLNYCPDFNKRILTNQICFPPAI